MSVNESEARGERQVKNRPVLSYLEELSDGKSDRWRVHIKAKTWMPRNNMTQNP
jgi:hypothetical protein